MKKNYFKSLLTALLLLCSTVASAHDFEVDGIYYIIANSTAKTVAVTYSGSSSSAVAGEYSGIVTIPSTVTYNNVTYTVEGIGKNALYGCTGVIIVNISEGVKKIGDYAFYDCTGLAKVTMPNSITFIGQKAFYNCSGLKSITIPSNVTEIGYLAFDACPNLRKIDITDLSAWCKINFGGWEYHKTEVNFDLYLNGEKVTNLVIPSDITEIKKYTFFGCTGLASVEIPNSVTTIGDRAFCYCSGLTSVEIPNSVTSIGNKAFYSCSGLTSIEIPNSVTSIGNNAFAYCTGLTSVTIPNSVTTIGEDAFSNCTGLTAVHISDLSAWCKINFVKYASSNPLYYAKNLYLNGEKVTNLVIPSDITEIKEFAFDGCAGFTDITFHDNVMLINRYAFSGCTGLTNITIGNGVMVLGDGAFKSCSNLRCITIPNSVISIGASAFDACRNLYTVIDYSDLGITKGSTENGYAGYYAKRIYTSGDEIPQDYIFETIDGVNTLVAYLGKSNDVVLPSDYNNGNYAIGDSAFYETTITSIEIPNSVTSIGNYAFYGCTGLTSITIPNSVTTIGYSAFYGCPLEKVEINTTTIGSWFSGSKSIKEIIIGSGVTTIGNNAFYGCPLEKVEINTTTIGSWFSGFKSIKEIIIGSSVTSIGNSAFSNCTGLTSVEIPNSVTSIGSEAFYQCTGLASIEIPNSVTSIGSEAFYQCTGLASIEIPNSVTSIENIAFYNCTGLTSVEIPNSVTSIGDRAFSNCTLEKVEINTTTIGSWFSEFKSIKEIIIGSSVTSVDTYAFYGCESLASIKVESGNTVYDSRENCNAIIETATNKLIQGCRNTIIPNSVTSIGDRAFSNCTGLTSIAIPNSVTSIGDRAFSNCTGLTSIAIPNSVTTIGNYAFSNCTGLTSIAIPNSVTSIGNYAFYGCTGLTSVEIPNSVTSIGNNAFYGCPLEKVEINATTIGPWFNGYDSIKEIVIGSGVTTIGSKAFYQCTGLTSVTIPNSVTSIGNSAFNGCTGITEIYAMSETPATVYVYTFSGLPTTATLYVPIGSKATYQAADYWKNFTNIVEFELESGGLYYSVLSASDRTCEVTFKGSTYYEVAGEYTGDIVIPEKVTLAGGEYTVTGIGASAFHDCTGLTSIEIPNSVTSIGNSAFSNCTGLTSVTIPNSVTSIGSYAFEGCTGLTSVTIPNSVTSIENIAFYNCTGLTSVEIPNSVTEIGRGTFWGCSGLTSVEIPNSVTSIGERAFSYCSGLTSIAIPNSVTSIGDHAFSDCSGLTSVSIGNSVTLIGRFAFRNCTGITEIYSMSSTPATANSLTFSGVPTIATLYVPIGTKAAYQAARYWERFANIVEMNFDIKGDITGDESVDVSDLTTLVGMILDSSLSTAAADINGDGSVDVSDLTSLVSIILGTDTASEAPAKAAATRAAALSTISAEGDGSDLIINVTNPDFPFTAIQFDIYFPEGLEISGVEEDGVYYYDAYVGSRTNKRSPHNVEAAAQADGSVRVMLYSGKNTNFTGTEGDIVALSIIAADGVADGEYDFQIKNAIISNPAGEQQKLAEHTGWITVTDGVTGIDAIFADGAASSNGAIYDLQGRKVTETVKGGIYIKDGKKFIAE